MQVGHPGGRSGEDAKAGELDAVTSLLARVGLTTEGVADSFPHGYQLIRRGEQVIAVAGLELYDGYGLLRSVAVDTEHRGKGLARELCESQLRSAARLGLQRVYLLTTTAAEYFRRLGFVPAARGDAPLSIQGCKEFSMLCPSSAALMARDPTAGLGASGAVNSQR